MVAELEAEKAAEEKREKRRAARAGPGGKGMPGTGGPGYQINCEINNQKHQAGTLAMAHAGRDTGGSQFYICFEAQPHLDGVHTVFGLTGNMDTVMKLQNGSRINKVTIQS